MAATARMFEWYDHSSDSSRVMPHSLAVFSPTVISMFRLGASGVSGCDGGRYGSTPPKGKGERAKTWGKRVIDSTPPATTTLAMSDRIWAAAHWTAAMPVAHWRWSASPGVSGGRPRATAT